MLSQRALSSILGAAGPRLRQLEINRTQTGISLLTLLGTYGQPPPFPWLSTLKCLILLSEPIPKGALRAVDRALGRLPALETLKVRMILVNMDLTISSVTTYLTVATVFIYYQVYSYPADAFLVLLMRQRERGGLARLRSVNFSYSCTKGAGLLLMAFIKAHGEGAARGLRSQCVTSCDSVKEALRRVLGERWIDG